MEYTLNERQRVLVEENLSVVRYAIQSSINADKHLCGFEFDDLYQEGCIWLCKAAIFFDDSKGIQFKTYANRLVTNGLITYCRSIQSLNRFNKNVAEINSDEDGISLAERLPDADVLDEHILQMDIMYLLAKMKKKSSGTVRLGLEAIEWKIIGLNGAEIATIYGVKPNLVGAWISRAAQRLKENESFAEYIPRAG